MSATARVPHLAVLRQQMWICTGCGTSNDGARLTCEVCDLPPLVEAPGPVAPAPVTYASSSVDARTGATRRASTTKRWLGIAAAVAIASTSTGLFVIKDLRQQVTGLGRELDSAKAGLAEAQRESLSLRQDSARARTTETDLRKRLRDNDIRSARTVDLDDVRTQLAKSQGRLQEVERDNASLRQQLERSQVAVAAAETELRQRQRESDARSARPAPAPVPAPVVPTSQALVQSLMRDAEARLAQRRFEAARTIVESVVLRVDPGNTQASSLLERIKARELQYLRDETTLK